jgi:two-component system, chemotaxis family, protein-glutamate methylesterase/glutaminase
MPPRVRVLIVDDSAFMRGAIGRLLAADPRFEVAGQASDGQQAVQLAEKLRPDVITMDFNMPGLNGADATRAILARCPARIVMLSAHTREGAAATVAALAAGAIDFVAKPGGEVSPTLTEIKEPLTKKLLEAAGARAAGSAALDAPVSAPRRSAPQAERSVPRSMPPGLRVVLIASSTGGPAALVRVVPELKLKRDAALVIVQHMPLGFTAALAAQLSERAPFAVREASHGERLQAGVGLVAPGGRHVLLQRDGSVRLEDSAPVHGVRPAADVTFKSAALAYGPRAVGVVLTGMGRDGALGLAAIKAAGGRTLAQGRESSTVYGMPKAAAELGVVDEIAELDRIGAVINRLVGPPS